jgi:hypothetical protein
MTVSREMATAFVEGYGRTWGSWDLDGFVDLFKDDVVYVEHPVNETVVGGGHCRWLSAAHFLAGVQASLVAEALWSANFEECCFRPEQQCRGNPRHDCIGPLAGVSSMRSYVAGTGLMEFQFWRPPLDIARGARC